MYPKDPIQTKSIVGAVWLLDTLHTCLVMASVWNYLIPHFGDIPRIDFIPWTVASTIAITATLTIIVHCFLARRIHSLTKNAWRITAPILILAILRLCSACVTTAEMIRLKSFKEFSEQFRWVFTLGLALSSSVDVLITITLCYKLRSSRTGSRSLDNVIDSLVLYSFENGSLTCAGTVLSMIFWLTMPYNRLFLALHFIIAKLYANSLLATLNMRKKLRDSQFKMTPSGDHAAITFPEFSAASGKTHARQSSSGSDSSDNTVVDMMLQINVQKTVDTRFDEDEDEPATPDIV